MAPRWSTSLLQFRLGLSLLSLLAAPSLGRLPRLPDGEVVDENNLVEGAPQPLSLSDAARLFVRLNQEEEQGARSEGQEEREDARLIGITDGGLYRGGTCHVHHSSPVGGDVLYYSISTLTVSYFENNRSRSAGAITVLTFARVRTQQLTCERMTHSETLIPIRARPSLWIPI